MSYRGEPIDGAPLRIRQLTDEERQIVDRDLFLVPGFSIWLDIDGLRSQATRKREEAKVLDIAANYLGKMTGQASCDCWIANPGAALPTKSWRSCPVHQ